MMKHPSPLIVIGCLAAFIVAITLLHAALSAVSEIIIFDGLHYLHFPITSPEVNFGGVWVNRGIIVDISLSIITGIFIIQFYLLFKKAEKGR